jgi:hypothetical protein
VLNASSSFGKVQAKRDSFNEQINTSQLPSSTAGDEQNASQARDEAKEETTYLCFKVPVKPTLVALTKWTIPT